MKMMIASMLGAGGLLTASQLSTSNIDAMITEEMGLTDPMLKTAANAANAALGVGGDVSFTVLAVAAMPIVFHLAKAGASMLQQEHDLSIARRRKKAGLDRGHPEAAE
jgi:hypothetical protein